MNKKNKGYINNIVKALTELSLELKDKDAAYVLSIEDKLEEAYNQNINYLEAILYEEEAELENAPKGAKAAEDAKMAFKNVNKLDGAIDKLDSLVDALDNSMEGHDIVSRLNVVIDKLNEVNE